MMEMVLVTSSPQPDPAESSGTMVILVPFSAMDNEETLQALRQLLKGPATILSIEEPDQS